MAVNPSPFGPKPQFVTATGAPASGYKLFFYVSPSVATKQSTFTDYTGAVANTNPIVLNTLGEPSTEIWFTSGQTYTALLAPPTDTDPPTSPIWTIPGLRGQNDATLTIDQWIAGPQPTFVSGTSFTLSGDQTSNFQVGRRLKIVDAVTTKYATISASSYDGISLTTVTVVNDGAALSSPLASVSYGLLSATNPSIPAIMTGGVSYAAGIPNITIVRGALFGLTLSTAGASATMSIAAGFVADSTNAVYMVLAAIAKTTSAWAVGTAAGGLDTAAIANNTGYHFYVIRRPDTGVVDVVFSTNATTPTLPANYTQYRRIGTGRTNGSAQWTSFTQDGDYFEWASPVLDVSAAAPGSAAVTRTLTVPTGINVRAVTNVLLDGTTSGDAVYLSDLAVTDIAPSTTVAPLAQVYVAATLNGVGQVVTRTNTSGQIRSRMLVGAGSNALRIATTGWYDRRGQDA